MAGVIAAQTVGFGKVSRRVCEVWVETDDIQLNAELVDPVGRAAQRFSGDPASAMGSSRGRSYLDSARSHTSAASSEPGSLNTNFTSAEVSR